MSVFRSTIVKKPSSSMVAMSPACSHPSGSIDARVACSLP
jgi:hypothetical protein